MAERYHIFPHPSPHPSLQPLLPQVHPLLQASGRRHAHPFLLAAPDASKAGKVELWTGWVEALGALYSLSLAMGPGVSWH